MDDVTENEEIPQRIGATVTFDDGRPSVTFDRVWCEWKDGVLVAVGQILGPPEWVAVALVD